MKHIIKTTFQEIASDRKMLALLSAVTVGALVYVAYVAISIQPSDLQLAIRYTSFGETQYYRDRWFYLLNFIGLGVLFLLAHLSIIAKLHVTGMKPLAYAFSWFSILMLVMMFIYTYLVLGIAYLS